MAYELRTRKRTYQIVESRIDKTNLTRYEIFYRSEKVAGYIDRPDKDCCDLSFTMKCQRDDICWRHRRGRGNGYLR